MIEEAGLFGLYIAMSFTAIILAAGKGTRMKSALPKPLHRVGGHAMLAWSIDAARAAGAERIVTVLAPGSDDIQSWLAGEPYAIQEEQLGTGSAVAAARDQVGEANGVAVVMFADTPLVSAASLQKLAAGVEAGAGIVIAGFAPDDPTGYGRLVEDESGHISRIVEHKDASADERGIGLCNGGIMAVRRDRLFTWLDRVTNDNAKGEYYLTDIVALATEDGVPVTHLLVDESEVMGVNDRKDLARAEAMLQDRLRQAAMEAGVTMIAPETVFLSADAVIERDVIIEPHVVIGPGCHLGEGSIIHAFSHLEGARLGACCIVGPYARLRPGTDAGDGVKIGNFVEVKKSRLGDGAKANHLTYLGDAEVGAAANIGAGTITCNYDGFGKYRTLIGDGAFVGSNSSLVAPVSIGAGAIIGAGSTITDDVAADSIAVSRAEERQLKGAAEKFRDKRRATNEEKG